MPGGFKREAVTHLREYFDGKVGPTPSLRLFNLRQEFPTQWHRFLNPTNPPGKNVFELEMLPNLFPIRDQGKTLNVNTISLLARCTNVGTSKYEYKIVMETPFPAPQLPTATDTNEMNLTVKEEYGGLYFSQKDKLTLIIKVVPTGLPVKWKIIMTHSNGGNLQEDPVKKVMEVEDVLLVLGYEWEKS